MAKYRSAYAVRADSAGVQVKALKSGERAIGRFPFKTAAHAPVGASASGFDTAHYQDEIRVMKSPVSPGQKWMYREPGSPLGLRSATKTFLGPDSLLMAGTKVPAFGKTPWPF